ncbi:unnamed protein product [Prorocentrum cordatum]|uniref:Uncharacterized protein n=1 Tax=Prorocentrum cordatum TaxID=2364126 RepID=A0ABN9WG61_9DINO|nr:unnamed protein product [Polarella glacialis]
MAAMDVSVASGAARVASMPVGERVNYALYQQVGTGTPVRVAGRFSSPGVLTTTDGGAISVDMGSELDAPDAASFVEVVGTKAAGDQLAAAGLFQLPSGQVDEELWNEAVKLATLPQLREMFAPAGGVAPPAAGGA